MAQNLSEMTSGFAGEILNYQGDEFILGRLIEMGFVRGERIQVLRKTPFGDFVVSVKGTDVALRREEASCLIVQ